MQKIHDKQYINILNKDRKQHCSFTTLPHSSSPDPALGSRICHLEKQHAFTKFNFFGHFKFTIQLIVNKVKE